MTSRESLRCFVVGVAILSDRADLWSYLAVAFTFNESRPSDQKIALCR